MSKSHHEISHLSCHIYHLLCVLGLVCFFTSCHWHEAKNVIATADSLDQTEHVIYDDTAALGRAIRSLDNPFGRLFEISSMLRAKELLKAIEESPYCECTQETTFWTDLEN